MVARFRVAGASALLLAVWTGSTIGIRSEVTPPKLKSESHTLENGRRVVNLAGFAPAAQWAELSSLLPPGSDSKNEAA